MKQLKLTCEQQYILLDDSDFNKIAKYQWYYNGQHTSIQANIEGRTISIGKFLMSCPDYLDVDHKDLNILNNQKYNLRIATRSQNKANVNAPCNNTSGYKGVCWDRSRGKWIAKITVEGQIHNLGRFMTIEAAAKAYNIAAIKYFKEFAKINILE